MAVMSQITDHEDQAQARLPEQFKGKVLTIAMVRALAAETQDIEDAAFPMFSLLNIATMIGAQLDGIGDILTEPRDGKSDTNYRIALFAKGARITASGTPEQVIERFLALTGSTVAVYYGEAFPAGYSLYGDRSACVYPRLWTPADIATALWLDADDASTITQSGGDVSQWDDKSGENAHAANASAPNQPLTSAHVIDGKNVIRFDGNDTLETVLNPLGATIEDVFVYMVARRQTDSGWSYIWSVGNNNDRLGFNPDIPRIEHKNRNINLATSDLPSDDVAFLGGYYGSTAESTMESWLNGALSGAKANAVSADSVTQGIVVGGRIQNSGDSGHLDIAEFIVVKGVRDSDAQRKLEGYLAWKWGLEGSLPGGHPYKLASPMVLLACDLLPIMEAASPAGVYVGLMDFGIWEDDDPMLWEDSDTVYLTYDSSGR